MNAEIFFLTQAFYILAAVFLLREIILLRRLDTGKIIEALGLS
jgi:hypothetical protein